MAKKFESELIEKLRDPEYAKLFGGAQARSSFAITLARAREEKGLTQKELAQKLKISQAYIAELESGEANPTLERIGSLLAGIGLSLITGTTDLVPVKELLPIEKDWQKNIVQKYSMNRSGELGHKQQDTVRKMRAILHR